MNIRQEVGDVTCSIMCNALGNTMKMLISACARAVSALFRPSGTARQTHKESKHTAARAGLLIKGGKGRN